MIPTLISTTTASGTPSSLSITSGIDSTYDEYMFNWSNIVQTTVNETWEFQCSTDGGSNYDTTVTSTYFYSENKDDNTTATGLGYHTGKDQAQGTSFQTLVYNLSPNQNEGMAGTLHLFAPSNTTYVKHWYARTHGFTDNNYIWTVYSAGYFNTTSAIDAIQFQLPTGTIYDGGFIQLYGIE